jgi:antitoxin (DNA-binding transcriptional repressor) of toxin-antitoxin stability system
MTRKYSATKLRANLYQVLDTVLQSGVPVEIERNGKLLKIVPVGPPDKFANLKQRPDYLAVDPEEIVHIDWSKEWRNDLP